MKSGSKIRRAFSLALAFGSVLDLGATSLPSTRFRLPRRRSDAEALAHDQQEVLRDWQKVGARLARPK